MISFKSEANKKQGDLNKKVAMSVGFKDSWRLWGGNEMRKAKVKAQGHNRADLFGIHR